MSAGNFLESKYSDNLGRVYKIRVQPETLAFTDGTTANTPPAGAIDQQVTAYARGSTRRFGVTARKITLRFTGALPDGYSGDDVSIPVLTQAAFNAYTGVQGVTGTYLSQPVMVVASRAEKVR